MNKEYNRMSEEEIRNIEDRIDEIDNEIEYIERVTLDRDEIVDLEEERLELVFQLKTVYSMNRLLSFLMKK